MEIKIVEVLVKKIQEILFDQNSDAVADVIFIYYAFIYTCKINYEKLFKIDVNSYNHFSINFLYFSIFLLRIFSMGPNNLLKASLSIETTVTAVSALILACLTVFLTNAISPK